MWLGKETAWDANLRRSCKAQDGNGTERNHKLSEYYLRIAKQAGLKRAIDKYEEYEYGEETKNPETSDYIKLILSLVLLTGELTALLYLKKKSLE